MRAVASILSVAILLSGCAQNRTICGITYTSYGILNESDKKNPDISYEVVWGNVILGVLLFETVVAPIYFFGFSLMQPVGRAPVIKGAIPSTSTLECPK